MALFAGRGGPLDLLGSEFNGLSVNFEAVCPCVQVRTSGVDVFSNPHSFFTNGGTSPKMVRISESRIGFAPHNILLQSQDFSTTWTNQRSSESVNVTIAPDGTLTADKLIEDSTATNTHYLEQSVSFTAGYIYTFSCYLKAAERTWAKFVFSSTAFGSAVYCNFNLTSGVVGTPHAGAISYGIESVGNGWYRCYVAAVCTTTISAIVAIRTSTGDEGDSYTGNGTSGLYVWGAQLNRGFNLSPYIATTTAAKYGLPISFYEGLLTERAATNLCIQSQDLATTWTNSATSETVNATTAPDGSLTADKLIEDSTSANHRIEIDCTFTISTTYIFSCYLKAAERTWAKILTFTNRFPDNVYGNFDLTNGVVGTLGSGALSQGIESIGDGWYRCWVTGTCDLSGTGQIVVELLSADNTGGYLGNGSSGIYVWGAQVEATLNTGATHPTSYIHTVTATVTRATDAINVATSAYPHSDTNGTIIVWVKGLTADTTSSGNIICSVDNGTTSEQTYVALSADNPDKFGINIDDGGSPQVAFGTTKSGTQTLSGNKVAAFWKLNDSGVLVDAGTEVTDTTCTMPTVTSLKLGYGVTTLKEFDGFIRRFIFVPRRITQSQMQTQTT